MEQKQTITEQITFKDFVKAMRETFGNPYILIQKNKYKVRDLVDLIKEGQVRLKHGYISVNNEAEAKRIAELLNSTGFIEAGYNNFLDDDIWEIEFKYYETKPAQITK